MIRVIINGVWNFSGCIGNFSCIVKEIDWCLFILVSVNDCLLEWVDGEISDRVIYWMLWDIIFINLNCGIIINFNL